MILYKTGQLIVRTLWPLVGRLDIKGIENLPETGPFLLIANHQSVLDPILIQAACPRPIHTMAKSTQFASPLFAWLMPRLLSFPVRRFETDPQAVRIVLRRLDEGEPVGIYVEGERSWDGELQQPRLGVLRLVLKAGVPVIPCTINGSYDALPRWSRAIRRTTIRITFGAPIEFPKLDRRADREVALPATAKTLMDAIAARLGP